MRKKTFIFESIDFEKTPPEYTKSKGVEVDRIAFYIRFIGEWFTPCMECQRELKRKIAMSKEWTLGNKDYEPPVELKRSFEIDDDSWEDLERHKATKDEIEKIGTGKTTYIKEE